MSSSTESPTGAQWQSPTTQNAATTCNSTAEEEGVTSRPMRLKVLYTFDDQNKTNCLARWPSVLQIRTVTMDATTTIGVIELKTCIQAIVQCSPELVAKLGQDYTVYAYDFSEYDLPLVGQGMLSWALAASSPTPDGPASESQKLITGRVCNNIQGLFSNGVKETLEVKLRLVPVPTVLQSEYLNSMEKYREVSRYIPASLDQNEWISFLRMNPNIGQMAQQITSMVPGRSHEVVNQLLSPSISQHNSDPFNNPAGNEGTVTEGRSTPAGGRPTGKNSRSSSRASVKRPRKPRVANASAGGNTSGYEEGTDGEEGRPTKKRAKIVQGEWNGRSAFGAGTDSLLVAASTINSIRTFRPIAINPNSGAVAGSHLQEIPRAPTPVPGAGKKQSLHRAMSQSNLRRDSIASQASQPRYQSPYADIERIVLPQEQEVRMSIESAMTSPEKNNDSSGETPPDITSSPPVLRRGISTRNSSPQAPSSPVLPQMPRQDSGFMSGNVDDGTDLFGEDEMRLPDNEDVIVAAQYNARSQPAKQRNNKARDRHHGFAFEEVTPGPMELLPKSQAEFEPRPIRGHRNNSRPATARTNSRANSIMSDDLTFPPPPNPEPQPSPLAVDFQTPFTGDDDGAIDSQNSAIAFATQSFEQERTSTTTPYIPSLSQPTKTSRTASAGSLTLPRVAASEPVLPPTQLSRSQTWSEAPCPPSDNAVTTFATSRDAIAKRASIRQKLDDAVSRGEMPPYCQNCGAIETPTWRKCFAQEVEGVPGYHEYSDEPGKVIAIDVLTRDDASNPTSYKLFKKSLGPADDKHAFEEHLLCNPCGIWLSKFKQHRPEDKWYKEPRPRPGKRAGGAKKKGQGNGQPTATSEAYFQSDAPGPMDQFIGSNMDGLYEAPPTRREYRQASTIATDSTQPSLPSTQRPRASSLRPNGPVKNKASEAAVSALRRAIQSSPARYLGTHHSPIEIVEEDLGATRRTLFPSPRKDGSPKVLGELATNIILPITHHTPSRVKAGLEVANKENHAPVFEDADPLEQLIELAMLESQRPKTPTPKASSKLFKTPTRPTPSHRPVTRSQSRSNRSQRHDTLPQRTPSKTPSRRSPRNHVSNYESPFTANLNKILSETNDHNHSPSRHLDMGIDFSLPNNNSHLSSDALFHLPGFDHNQDFFSTDVPMPSSPPRFGSQFHLYEDPMSMGGLGNLNSDIWNEFQLDGGNDNADMNELGGLLVDENGRASFDFSVAVAAGVVIKKEPVEGSLLEGGNDGEKA